MVMMSILPTTILAMTMMTMTILVVVEEGVLPSSVVYECQGWNECTHGDRGYYDRIVVVVVVVVVAAVVVID